MPRNLDKQREYNRKYSKIWRIKNKEKKGEKWKQYAKDYYLKNKERIIKYGNLVRKFSK